MVNADTRRGAGNNSASVLRSLLERADAIGDLESQAVLLGRKIESTAIRRGG